MLLDPLTSNDRVFAAINPHMLGWARQSLGLSIQEAAESLSIPMERMRLWESGADSSDRPTVSQAERLAKLYDRPFSLFYLPSPPAEPALPPDFRFTPEAMAGSLPPMLRKIIRRAHAQREVALSLAEDLGETNEHFPVIERRTGLDSDPEAIGVQVRQWLGIGDKPFSSFTAAEKRFDAWRTALEDRGFLVFMSVDSAPASLFRGFALVHDRAPVLAINNKDEKPARLFTLLHELGHVLLRVPGVSGDPLDIPQEATEQVRIERWCNCFAAAALVPEVLLRAESTFTPVVSLFARSEPWEKEHDFLLRGMGKRFGVSAEVIVRRLVTLGSISVQTYREWRVWWYLKYPIRREPDSDKKSGPGQTIMVPHRLGYGFLRVVFEAYWRDRVNLSDLCRLVGNVQISTARKIENRFKARLFAMAG